MVKPRDPAKWVTRTCPECGKVFECGLSRLTRYCSGECYRAVIARVWITTNCPTCGKEFRYRRSWPRVYCSHPCAGKATIENIPSFAPSAFVAICQWCGEEFTTTPKATRGRFCSRQCWGKWLAASGTIAGENSTVWRGGYEPYYGANWREVRRLARERDGVCQDCGITPTELGHALDVHHIRPFREFGRERADEANDSDNLVALCNVCHTAREWGSPGRRRG